MSDQPLSPVGDGRGPGGRFAAGNRIAKGNPHARRVARLRAELLRVVTPADIKAVVAVLLEKAKAGDIAAIHELLNRLLGRPAQEDLLQRIEALEQAQQARRLNGVNHG